MAITSRLSDPRSDIARRTNPTDARDRDPQFATFGGTASDDTLVGTKQDDVMSGGDGPDLLVGRGGHDLLDGGPRDDRLYGGLGRDTLEGGDGRNLMVGNLGADSLTGGVNHDIFSYERELDAAPAEGDVITDFQNGDRFDMSAVDAVRGGITNEAFTFIGTGSFTGPGQLRVVQVGADTLLEANTVGGRGAEMEILMLDFDAFRLSAAHFVL